MSAQNSMLVQIARPYAAALFDVAQGENNIAAVEKSLDEVKALIGESQDFSRFLRTPVITADDKAAAMEKILAKANVAPLVANVIKVLARNGRLFALDAVAAQFKVLAAAARGEVNADVTSVVALDNEQRKALAEALKAKIGKTVTLTEHVDPSIIGGLVVKVGSQMIDSSLKTKLSAMKIAMKEVG